MKTEQTPLELVPMHNRQSGAAHVPIMFFLILLVLFLGALAFAYVMQNENTKLKQDLAQVTSDNQVMSKQKLLVDHYIEDIGRVINKPGSYLGREGSGSLYGDAALTDPMVMNPAEIKKIMDDACQASGVSTATSLENALGSMVTRINQLGERTRNIESERDKIMAEKADGDRKFQTATAEAASRASDLRQGFEQQVANFNRATQDNANTISTLQEGLRNKADDLIAAREEAATTEKGLRGEISTLKSHNTALIERNALRQPPDVADGKVIVASGGVKTAFIDLGRKDMLQPGTVFRVKNPRNEAVKAHATVTRVEEDRSEVALSGVVDPIGDNVTAGDLLFNELFSPHQTRTIFLIGRFQAPYNKPDLANLLRRLGNRVVDKMGPGVDTVILGNDPVNEAADGFTAVAELPEYKQAVDLRVEFVYLRQIKDLIKL
jgi:hypothetical protein